MSEIKNHFTTFISKTVSKERGEYLIRVLEDAYNFLVNVCPDQRPQNLKVNILDEQDWKEYVGDKSDYGMAYCENQTLMLAATSSEVTDGFIIGVRLLSPIQYFTIFKPVYRNPETKKPDLLPFIDFLAIHEMAHVFAEVNKIKFPTLWLDEIFANLMMHRFTIEHRASNRKAMEVLPEIINKNKLFRLLVRYKELQDVDLHYPESSSLPMNNVNYGWFELRLYHLSVMLLKIAGVSITDRFVGFGKKYQDGSLSNISHNELVDLLEKEICPGFADLLRNW